MLSRKPAILLSSYNAIYCPVSSHRPAPAGAAGCTTSCRPSFARSYAQHAALDDAHGRESDLSWPEAVHPHRSPTPYQILSCKRGQAYTKHRFYALVKLYHPDRSDTSSPVAHLPHHVRLERYRLLVAAHTLLSDDSKRKAYDAWGLGWAGHHQTPTHASQHSWTPDQRQWTHDPQYNATWEDWERWYQRESGTEGETRDFYVSNFAFVSLVVAIVTIGGVMQGTRASVFGTSVMEQRDRIHREASMELARSKHATLSGDRNERIKTFLEHREATLTGEEAYQRLLPPADTCAPDTVRKH